MSKKENKVTKFVAKHEKGIRMGLTLATTACACYVGYRIGSKSIGWYHSNDSVMHVLNDISKKYKSIDYFTGINDDGLAVSELGKLGEEMVNCGAELGDKLTHFIVIGKGTGKYIN